MQTGIRMAGIVVLVLITGAAGAIPADAAKPREEESAKSARSDSHGLTFRHGPAVKPEEEWKDGRLMVTLKGHHNLWLTIQVIAIPRFSPEG